MDITVGRVVCSRSGRDKGRFYVVTALSGGKAWVCDGRHRRQSNPKLKNLKHLAPTQTAVSLPQTDKGLRVLLREFNVIMED